jgi:hypothetical protein
VFKVVVFGHFVTDSEPNCLPCSPRVLTDLVPYTLLLQITAVVEVCRDLVQSKRLAPGTVSAKDIGVIAAFRQQVRCLHLLLVAASVRSPGSPCSYATIANCTGAASTLFWPCDSPLLMFRAGAKAASGTACCWAVERQRRECRGLSGTGGAAVVCNVQQ